mmetsp:Transcript_30535/g.81470  ORF Transcript_30535/g.81470 Transcript_30535/m.81470 type:complete len:242 (+) Transcript_30535:1342-2067(+)
MVASSILLTALIINSMMTNTVGILWPLFMQRHFQWTDSQYSYLLLAAGISSSVALGVLPTMQKRVGPGLTRVAASALSAVCATAGFMIKQPGGEAVHCALMLTCLFLCATLDPSLQAGISLRFLGLWHGRSFGGMAALIGIGSVLANLISTGVFDATYDSEGFFGGGSSVMLLMGLLQACCAGGLFFVHRRLDQGHYVDLELHSRATEGYSSEDAHTSMLGGTNTEDEGVVVSPGSEPEAR